MACTHQDQVRMALPQEAEKAGGVCPECVAIGSHWVHLRYCLTCGHIGCCDNSPNRHGRRHWQTSTHPIITSFEPGEDWSYCFEDDSYLRLR